ncbi:hypothetical protein evm_014370 [Chilo suppressalis]|nr:hypothetical protein evm_014370 [Chilo suppressalis]
MAIDLGYRHIDTAYTYKVEDQVGRALRMKIEGGMKREDVYVTTKLWNDRHARDAVVPALRQSLQALNLSYVDLYLIHWPIGQFANLTFDYTDYLETWRGMTDAKQLGLTKSIGVSNFNQSQIERILDSGLETPAVLQVEVNLNLQQPELLSYCKTKGITVMGYTPFGSLFHTKARSDAPPPRINDSQMSTIAANHNKTVTQIVLRYLIDIGVIPIPKALSYNHLASNIDIYDFNLTETERSILKAFDKGYRTIPQLKWIEHPYYPFQKANRQQTVIQ